MSETAPVGFVGLGTMGAPMCRHLARKSGRPVIVRDERPEPVRRLVDECGALPAASLADLAARAEVTFLSLPGGPEVEAVAPALLAAAGPGRIVVDCSTVPAALTRTLAARFAAAGARFIDAPVARTRDAAEAGALSVTAGGDKAAFDRVRPLLACFATDIAHCGPPGAGQTVKILNNMVLTQTIAALAEALCIARRVGVDGETLFAALAKGSADSFALRRHGMKALLPGDFPERAHSCRRALKDLDCALELAGEAGLRPRGAEAARGLLEAAIAMGLGEAYYPALIEAVDRPPPGN